MKPNRKLIANPKIAKGDQAAPAQEVAAVSSAQPKVEAQPAQPTKPKGWNIPALGSEPEPEKKAEPEKAKWVSKRVQTLSSAAGDKADGAAGQAIRDMMKGLEPTKPEDKAIKFEEGAFPTLGAPKPKRVAKPSQSPEREEEALEASSVNAQATSAAATAWKKDAPQQSFGHRARQLQQEDTTAAAAAALAQQNAQKLADQAAKRNADAERVAREAQDQKRKEEEEARQKRKQE